VLLLDVHVVCIGVLVFQKFRLVFSLEVVGLEGLVMLAGQAFV
jgi:hypothetical protein